MSDEDDDNIIHSEPIFEAKYMGNRAPPDEIINSKEDVVNLINRHYWKIILKGKYKILKCQNGEVSLLDKSDFISDTQQLRLPIADSDGKVKLTPFSTIWLE